MIYSFRPSGTSQYIFFFLFPWERSVRRPGERSASYRVSSSAPRSSGPFVLGCCCFPSRPWSSRFCALVPFGSGPTPTNQNRERAPTPRKTEAGRRQRAICLQDCFMFRPSTCVTNVNSQKQLRLQDRNYPERCYFSYKSSSEL
jgi:hypothetical protein